MATVGTTNAADLSFHVPAPGMTLAQFRDWAESDDYPDRGKVLYFRGELYFDMSPERIDSHAALKEAINRTIGNLVHDTDLGRYYPDGAGIQNEGAKVANEPDAVFAKWATIESGRLMAPSEKRGLHTALVGTPDWVCEIVSDSSVEKDTQVLREAYHAAGIPEYWLIDARGDEIQFSILSWQPDAYAESPPVDDWHRSKVFDLEFQVTRHRDRVGWWQYDLRYR
jgi:Uma2 family endonuclease